MRCPLCGAENTEEAAACSECEMPFSAPDEPDVDYPGRRANSSFLGALGVATAAVVVVVLVAGLVVGAARFMAGEPKDAPKRPPKVPIPQSADSRTGYASPEDAVRVEVGPSAELKVQEKRETWAEIWVSAGGQDFSRAYFLIRHVDGSWTVLRDRSLSLEEDVEASPY